MDKKLWTFGVLTNQINPNTTNKNVSIIVSKFSNEITEHRNYAHENINVNNNLKFTQKKKEKDVEGLRIITTK